MKKPLFVDFLFKQTEVITCINKIDYKLCMYVLNNTFLKFNNSLFVVINRKTKIIFPNFFTSINCSDSSRQLKK